MRKIETDADFWIERVDIVFTKHGYASKTKILNDKANEHFITIKLLSIPVSDEKENNKE